MVAGDHVYVQRLGGVYAHHGIDCGDGSVIHYTGEHWHTPRRVQQTPFARFARDGEVRVRDYRDFFAELEKGENLPRRLQATLQGMLDGTHGRAAERRAFAPAAVLARARSRLGESRFDILLHNCEHFATWCKTGISDSAQVWAIWRAALTPGAYWRLRGLGLSSALLDRDASGVVSRRNGRGGSAR